MKKLFLFLITFSFLTSCQKESVAKPDNLIPKETMENIIYDLSILQAMRNSNQAVLDTNNVNAATYIYKKYKIDSLQFAKSNQYYAAESVKDYAKMYDNVNGRLVANKAKIDTLNKKKVDTVKVPAVKKPDQKDRRQDRLVEPLQEIQ